jgi:hypothetical protein
MLGAPMLFLENVIHALMKESEKLDERFIGFLGIFYIGGWMASAIGIRKLKLREKELRAKSLS